MILSPVSAFGNATVVNTFLPHIIPNPPSAGAAGLCSLSAAAALASSQLTVTSQMPSTATTSAGAPPAFFEGVPIYLLNHAALSGQNPFLPLLGPKVSVTTVSVITLRVCKTSCLFRKCESIGPRHQERSNESIPAVSLMVSATFSDYRTRAFFRALPRLRR